jgi:hypothetical protein
MNGVLKEIFFFSAISELRDMFKPLTSVRNFTHKPDLTPNATHVAHTPIYVFHMTLTINIICSSILYSKSDICNRYNVFCRVRT